MSPQRMRETVSRRQGAGLDGLDGLKCWDEAEYDHRTEAADAHPRRD